MIFIGHSIQKKQNALSSQVLMENSPGLIIPWVTNKALVNFRKLKSYQGYFRPQCYETRYPLQEKIWKKYTWKLNNTLLNKQEITEEFKK